MSRDVHVRRHTRRAERPYAFTRRDPLEPENVRQWDFGDYKFHPLWNSNPEDEPQLRIKVGDTLYRGTSSAYTSKSGAKSHQWPSSYNILKGPRRIYLSEGAEDAAGYGEIAAETVGGKPMLCEVTLTEELFRALKPGYEGSGEWYVEAEALPKRAALCIPLKIDEYGQVQVPWEKLML